MIARQAIPVVDLLGERRSLVRELRRERDATARAVLEAQIRIIDEQLKAVR